MTRGERIETGIYRHVKDGVCYLTARWTAGKKGEKIKATASFNANDLGLQEALRRARRARQRGIEGKILVLNLTKKEKECPIIGSEKYISWFKGPKYGRYQVTFSGTNKFKVFSESTYLNRRHALAAARRYRDRVAQNLYGPDWRALKHPRLKAHTGSSTGILGVTIQNRGKSGNKKECVVATWQIWKDDKRASKERVFTVSKHGMSKAVQLAIKARREGVADDIAETKKMQKTS